MQAFLNHMRQVAQTATQGQARTRIGIVSGYDPSTYSAKVLLQPENTETGWLPITSAWIGNGWGLFTPPTPGDMCHVEFQEGSLSTGIIVGRFFNDSERPAPVPSGEAWLLHQSGSFLKLTNDGKVLINGNTEIDVTTPTLNITVTGNANVAVSGTMTSSAAQWNHTGNVKVDGAMLVTKTITGQQGIAITGGLPGGGGGASITGTVNVTSGDVKADSISLKSHTHSGVQGGSSNTGGPQ